MVGQNRCGTHFPSILIDVVGESLRDPFFFDSDCFPRDTWACCQNLDEIACKPVKNRCGAHFLHFRASLGADLVLDSGMDGSCWDFGIYPLRHPRDVRAGDALPVTLSLSDGGRRLDLVLSEELVSPSYSSFFLRKHTVDPRA